MFDWIGFGGGGHSCCSDDLAAVFTYLTAISRTTPLRFALTGGASLRTPNSASCSGARSRDARDGSAEIPRCHEVGEHDAADGDCAGNRTLESDHVGVVAIQAEIIERHPARQLRLQVEGAGQPVLMVAFEGGPPRLIAALGLPPTGPHVENSATVH